MIRRRRFLKIVLPLFVLVGALAVAGYLQATKPRLEPEAPSERIWLISTLQAVIADRQPELLAYGEITARRDVEMRALVAGQVVAVGENFIDGGVLRAGDLLVQIDPFEFDAAVAEWEARVKEALRKLSYKPTVIWIAHRLSTVVDVNRVLMVDRGRIVADGSHKELLAQSGAYRDLVETQLVSR